MWAFQANESMRQSARRIDSHWKFFSPPHSTVGLAKKRSAIVTSVAVPKANEDSRQGGKLTIRGMTSTLPSLVHSTKAITSPSSELFAGAMPKEEIGALQFLKVTFHIAPVSGSVVRGLVSRDSVSAWPNHSPLIPTPVWLVGAP
jgi:hypothetical protein